MEQKPNRTDLAQNRAIEKFSYEGDFVFLHKKTEKIASALYMVTSLFDRDEPLRYSIRQKATDLIDVFMSLRNPGSAPEVQKQLLRTLVADLVSYLNLAAASGLISEMNAAVISRELNALEDRVERVQEHQSVYPRFSEDFFDSVGEYDENLAQGDRNSSKAKRSAHVPQQRENKRKEGQKNEVSSVNVSARTESPKPAVQAKKSKRQHEILKLTKEKGEIGVKDAARVVRDCSEKTIQRELNALVSEGTLKKEGKRRWTRYSFA